MEVEEFQEVECSSGLEGSEDEGGCDMLVKVLAHPKVEVPTWDTTTLQRRIVMERMRLEK